MGNSYSTADLKVRIAKDLHINVAFPFFPAGKTKGSAACCVVDADWIEKLTNSTDDRLVLNSPGWHASQLTTSPSNTESPQKQSPTTNIYVNIISKEPDQATSLELYQPMPSNPPNPSTRAPSVNPGWPLNKYITSLLEGEGAEQNVHQLSDSFDAFQPLLAVNDHQTYVNRIHDMLWPSSHQFRILSDPQTLNLRRIHRTNPTLTLNTTQPLTNETDLGNANLPEVFAILESDTAYYFLSYYRGTTLHDIITYNPGILSSNLKKSFVVYQILRALASLHSRGIVHGSLEASNILVDENLWVQLAGMDPQAKANSGPSSPSSEDVPTLVKEIPDEPLVMKWVRGDISNFSYLMALNHLAGRREGDPNFHPIMPWIHDFSGPRIEDGWRDFKKTKFRMNKGDEQLDFTFDGPVPHHITDILSDITYYVYLARRTPIPVLCQFVRSKYEPNEYPNSMQRLYSWTPDECIPEFYTDPSIFTSIHPDMPDLQIPPWASSPEDFIKKHAEMLESDYVSANLHYWIDLTFGNNLTGKGAVEAKNVALPLLAGQNSFMKHGIIQLFKDKHPQRGCNWNKAKEQCDGLLLKRHNDTDRSTSEAVLNDDPSSPDRMTDHSTPSITSQRSSMIRTQRHSTSVSPPTGLAIAENVTSLSIKKERASSVHSTCSSIDTSTSINSRSASAHAALESTTTATTTASNNMTSAIRSDPIRLPDELPDDYFTENLVHYEDTMTFSAKYKFDHEGQDLPLNPYLSKEVQKRYNIDPCDPPQLPSGAFSKKAAHDIDCAGLIIERIFAAGSSKVTDLDSSGGIQSAAGGYFEQGNGDVDYDIAPSGRINVPSAVTAVTSAMNAHDWRYRPTAKAVLCASFPAVTVRESGYSLPFPDCIPDMYEYLAEFYQAESTRRLYLADKWVDRICELEDEAFLLILPTFTRLFTHSVTRVGAISLFPKLAQRLGPEKARQYLLKPIISMFETLRPNLPKALFEQKVIDGFVERLGTGIFLQQMLPCYLESIAITGGDTSENGSVVSEMAGDALVHICDLLGPILTSKHIVRQLVKIVFRDNVAKPVLVQTMARIAKGFGETFTSIQYAYLLTLVDQQQKKSITIKNVRCLSSILSLLEHLLPYMSGEALATELKSGFVSTLYQLMEPLPPLSAEEPSSAVPENVLRLRLSLSMRTVNHLILLTRHLPRMDWEATVTTLLQKYFSGFTTDLPTGEDEGCRTPELLHAQRNYQMLYAYSQLCDIVSAEVMHRIIPTSDAIEKLMNDQFARPDGGWDTGKLYDYSTQGLQTFSSEYSFSTPVAASDTKPQKPLDKESSKSKVSTSVLPWKTRWKPSPEDRRNWNRFLSTNSEEMSKTMQFSFNDLKLRGYAGHTGAVRTVAVNEPTKRFASGSRDRTVKLWSLNVHEGIEQWQTQPYSECLMTYTGHRRGTINDVHFLTGTVDTIASCDGHVHLWDPETAKPLHQFNTGRPSVVSVKPTFRDRSLVGGTLEGNIVFFDTHNYKTLHTWKPSASMTGTIRTIAVNQSETLIAVGFSTGAISLLESRTGTLVASWKGGDTEITMIKFYTDELLVSCAPADHLLCCWDVTRLALVKTMSAPQDVISLDLFKDEILTINSNNSVSFIPVSDELQSYSSKFKASIIKSQVSAFAIVPTDQSLLFGCTEGEIFLYA